MKIWGAAALLSLALTAAALAADATGKWTYTQKRGQQEVKRTVELKQDGEKLTGAVLGNNGQKTEISEGSVKGDDVSFVVVRERNGQQIKIQYKGKLAGDTIK